MGPFMMVSGSLVSDLDVESRFGRMEVSMKAIGKTIKHMVREG